MVFDEVCEILVEVLKQVMVGGKRGQLWFSREIAMVRKEFCVHG